MFLEKFWERKQLQGETVDQYVAVLCEIAAKAFPNESPADRNSQILKRFPLGLNNDHLKAKFVRKPPLTLAEALTTARSYEALRPILPSLPVNVAAVSSFQACPDPPTPSFGYPGPQSRCQYCQRFGRHAQHRGHNPPIRRVGKIVPTSPDERQCPAPSLTSADGKPIAVFGRTVATVRLSAFVASHTFVCADIAADVILGMDFLERYKANIDFVRHVMRLNGCRIQLGQSVSALINDKTWTDDTSKAAGSFILDTDASDVAISAVLSQLFPDGQERVIAYGSGAFAQRFARTRRFQGQFERLSFRWLTSLLPVTSHEDVVLWCT
ncbi:hypothetical protein X801_07216 [Opisthorchis viverrini]|uniref:Reverse transcriptase/retrotransposon-derived protein RNase H-like domain-containing protein n=1 Tax=Opisthorchis viverrini TaxID=6198 RepID=A0A1S8WRQ8_OPIVI|nr:hypothetical protein X801_07216 [Opisthorchis viverrini]